jgi:hypothetical protein
MYRQALRQSTAGAASASKPTASVRLRACSETRSASIARSITSCLRPPWRTRTAAVPYSTSRPPITAMYGTFWVSASRMR